MARKVEVAGKVCLVTGGARGMGRLWASYLAADGARVALWDIDGSGLDEVAADLSRRGTDVYTAIVDVTDRDRVYRAAAEVKAKFGPVDVLINNAGTVAGGKFLEVDDSRHAATIELNLTSMIWTMKAFLPDMIARGAGHVVNVSSAAAFIGVPFMPAYCASKWGVIGLTESIRLELKLLGVKGIGWTLFCPSYVSTGMFEGVKPPLLVPLLTPEEAVRRGYEGFRKGQYIIREPFMVKLTPTLRTLLPLRAFDKLLELLRVTSSMETWTGRK